MRRGVLADHESPRFRELAGEAVEFQALVLRNEASAMPEGPRRDETEATVRRRLEEALDHVHRALDEWYAFEMVRRSSGLLALRAEYNASKICHLLGREEEALFHAEEALSIRDDVRPEPWYDRAWPLFALGFAPQAIDSMRRARGLGFDAPSMEIAGFFLAAAQACERDRLFVAAQMGYASAIDSAPPGPLQEDAKRRLDALRALRLMAEDEARERTDVAALDARLAAFPRSCPVRRDHSVPK
jgi:tetratricopeptide (TPR) repeat protein